MKLNSMKRIISIMLMLITVMQIHGISIAYAGTSGKCGENLNWTMKEGVLVISGTGPMEDMARGDYPWNGIGIITSVIIEEGVTSVGQEAFLESEFSFLISATIPNSIKYIGAYAFCGCKNLQELIIPDGVEIGTNAFLGCTKLNGYNVLNKNTLAVELPSTTEKSSAGVLKDLDYTIIQSSGFSYPVFYYGDLEDSTYFAIGNNYREMYLSDPYLSGGRNYAVYCVFDDKTDFYEKMADEDLLQEYVAHHMDADYPIKQEKLLRLDGHLARLTVYAAEGYDAWGYNSTGQLLYCRNNQCIRISVYCSRENECVTMSDLEKLAEHISYQAPESALTVDDVELIIKTKNAATVVPAGRKIQFSAEHKNTDKTGKIIKSVLANSKYNGYTKDNIFSWSVVDVETEESDPDISIDQKGTLLIEKTLNSTRKAKIIVESRIFHTKADCLLTIIPASSSIQTMPSEVFFYVGSNTPQSVKAVIEPETVPPIGLTWKAQKDGIVEITANDDGTASIKPIAAGKTTITVMEPGGKSVRLDASVVAPVEQIELKLSGKQIPGGKVAVKETLLPKNVGNKKVEWSLNVDESVATINEKGQINISKDAAVGTKIIVICKALGAPEPVVQTCEFDITEK